ncbi:hypothetical protein [Jiangella asiatica]|uniref:Uncharacterized protein n=1 Tax=Jiangella asiatica TaxID=2530372 RepID=A0A4R5DJC3_9ACTN|nr:hypothetical protein [Jiangella asiatica]TDE10663.1 hypothetical protein E1269_11355 [Jiangella asiatica]
MTAGEWFVVVGTGLQLVSIAVLWRVLHGVIRKVRAWRAEKPGARVEISDIALTSGELARVSYLTRVHGKRLDALEQQTRSLVAGVERLREPHPWDVTGGVLLAVGTVSNLTGSLLIALQ